MKILKKNATKTIQVTPVFKSNGVHKFHMTVELFQKLNIEFCCFTVYCVNVVAVVAVVHVSFGHGNRTGIDISFNAEVVFVVSVSVYIGLKFWIFQVLFKLLLFL